MCTCMCSAGTVCSPALYQQDENGWSYTNLLENICSCWQVSLLWAIADGVGVIRRQPEDWERPWGCIRTQKLWVVMAGKSSWENGTKKRPPPVGSCCVQGNETVHSLLVSKLVLKKSFPNISFPNVSQILPGASGEDHGIFLTCSGQRVLAQDGLCAVEQSLGYLF